MFSLEVIPDRFSSVTNDAVKDTSLASLTSDRSVRRPTRGIVLKDDTFATLRVIAVDGNGTGKPVTLIDAGSKRKDPATGQPYQVDGDKRGTDVYSNFLLQSVQEERVEKQQILETFGEPYIFLFGQRARMVNFQGVLLNTWDFNWEAEWWENYDRFIRGTKCVENNAMVFLSFDNTVVGGYIVSATCTKTSQEPYLGLAFGFQMFVVSYTNFSAIGDPNAKSSPYTQLSSFNSAESDPFRPTLIIPSEVLVQKANKNITSDTGLVEGLLEAGANIINSVVTAVNQVTNLVTSTINSTLNGVVVRVPIGFEGAIVFDDNGTTPIPGKPGPVIYSTFDKNDDEYVGSSTQYSSSFLGIGNNKALADQLAQTELQYDQALVKKAQGEWLKFGMQLPGNELGPVSAFLVGKGVGLLAAGASTAWKTGSIGAGSQTALSGLEVTTGFTTASALASNGQLGRSLGTSQLGRRGGGGSGG